MFLETCVFHAYLISYELPSTEKRGRLLYMSIKTEIFLEHVDWFGSAYKTQIINSQQRQKRILNLKVVCFTVRCADFYFK